MCSQILLVRKGLVGENIGFNNCRTLQDNPFAVLPYSRMITEGSWIFHSRALNIGQVDERPDAVEEASVVMAHLHPGRILSCSKQLHNRQIASERNS
ncbi:MAG: hypothetical protein H3C64_08290 [Candidatus Kuenenia stuttgartiensis]|nr:hypothetical protein [Candidatus Kuenenia stuttgartiensis]